MEENCVTENLQLLYSEKSMRKGQAKKESLQKLQPTQFSFRLLATPKSTSLPEGGYIPPLARGLKRDLQRNDTSVVRTVEDAAPYKLIARSDYQI